MTSSTNEEGAPPAVLDHAVSPPRILCRECTFGEDIPAEEREELSDDQIGDVCICDGCGVNIYETLDTDD